MARTFDPRRQTTQGNDGIGALLPLLLIGPKRTAAKDAAKALQTHMDAQQPCIDVATACAALNAQRPLMANVSRTAAELAEASRTADLITLLTNGNMNGGGNQGLLFAVLLSGNGGLSI